MNLVASLVVRNELSRYLPDCIGSLLEFCDNIRVLDDGSTDGTLEWFGELDDYRVQVTSVPESGFYVHEGATRQKLFEWTLAAQPSHILAIDADELVSDGSLLRSVCGQPKPAWSLMMEEVWGVQTFGGDRLLVRTDGGWRPHEVPILYRAPQATDGRQWRIADKALACGREPLAVRRLRARSSGVSVLHFGWACKADRAARFDRYVVADGGRFHANTHLESIMWPDEKVQTVTRRWPPFLAGRKERLTERIQQTTLTFKPVTQDDLENPFNEIGLA